MEHSEDEIQADSAGSGRPDGVASGIPEHRRTQEALRRSQEELQSVLGSIPDYLWSADIDSQGHVAYRYYSPGVEKITGRPPDFYMLGPERWLSTVHPADMPRIQKALQDIMNGQPLQRTEEYRIILPDGTVRWVRDNVQMRRQEGSTRVDGVVSDITERKETEDALRLSEARLKEALLAAQMGVWEWTVADGALTWDESFYRITGRDPKLLFPQAEEQAKMFAPESWERLKVAGENSLATGIPFELDLELIRPDGSKRWLIGRGKPWRDALGRITHLRGTIQDITERKRTEEELFLLKHSIDVFYDGAYWTDTDNRFIYVNDAGCKALGYEREELIGKTILDVNPQASPEGLKGVWQSLRSQGFFSKESVHRRKDGSEFPVELVATYVGFGGREFSCGFARDITKRKRVEGQLQKLSLAVEQSPATVVITDVQGNIEYVNPKFTQLTGYTAEEAMGQNPRILKSGLVPAETYRELWTTVLSGGEWHGEFANKKKNGELYWESASIVPIKDSGGVITHLLAVKEDITERKRAEEERQRSFEQLRALAARLQSIREEERMEFLFQRPSLPSALATSCPSLVLT